MNDVLKRTKNSNQKNNLDGKIIFEFDTKSSNSYKKRIDYILKTLPSFKGSMENYVINLYKKRNIKSFAGSSNEKIAFSLNNSTLFVMDKNDLEKVLSNDTREINSNTYISVRETMPGKSVCQCDVFANCNDENDPNAKIRKELVQESYNNTVAMSKFPKESYEVLAKKMLDELKKGNLFDSSIWENLFIDKENNNFHMIDIEKGLYKGQDVNLYVQFLNASLMNLMTHKEYLTKTQIGNVKNLQKTIAAKARNAFNKIIPSAEKNKYLSNSEDTNEGFTLEFQRLKGYTQEEKDEILKSADFSKDIIQEKSKEIEDKKPVPIRFSLQNFATAAAMVHKI